MGQNFRNLGLCDAVLFCRCQMVLEREICQALGHQSRHCDQRVVPQRQFFLSAPHLFIATAAAGKRAMERTMDALRGFTDCLPGAEVKGLIYGSGVYQKGEVRDTPVLAEAYQAGKHA